MELNNVLFKFIFGAPGWVSRLNFDFGSSHDLIVREFEPQDVVCADNSEPGVCFRFCVSLSLHLSRSHSVSLTLSKKEKKIKIKIKFICFFTK